MLTTGQGYDAQVANYACGAIVPASRRKHFTAPEDLQCPFCKAELPVQHMLLHCPATEQCRQDLQLPSHVGTFELQWGLFQFPPELDEFQRNLRARRWKHVPTIFAGHEAHFFTDGSTLHPADPIISLSAWAAVFAEPGKLDGTRVLHDFVPGDHHSNNRAELYAVLAAVLLGDGGVIFSDSDVAVVGFNLLLDYGLDALMWWKRSNLDIWVAIQKALRECSGAWRIVKVKSHEDWRSAPDDWHAWLWFHNDMVDDFAKSVFRNASCHIMQSHRKAVAAVVATRAVQKTVYDLQRRVADIFRDKKTTTATPSGSLPLFECLQLRFRDRVGMLHADAGCAFPRLPRAPNWDIFLLCAPFAQLLFEWCSRHSWVPNDQGF